MAIKELYGSREVDMSKGWAITGKRIFKCDWATRFTESPKFNEPFPGIPVLLVSHVNFAPWGKNKTGVLDDEYEFAKVTVDYSTPRWSDDIDSYSWDISSEVLEEGGGRTWLSDGAPITVPLNKIHTVVDLTIRRLSHVAPGPGIITLAEHVNDDTYFGYPRGRVRYVGACSEVQWNMDNMAWDYLLTYKFQIKVRDHNLAWRKDIQDYDYADPPIYPYANLGSY